MNKVHCPFCAHDITFMQPAFASQTYTAPPAGAWTTTASPTVESKLDDAVYSRDLQSVLWQRMHEKVALYAGMTPDQIISNAVAQKRPNREDGSVVMHLMFDRDVTPVGGVINGAVLQSTATVAPAAQEFDVEKLRTLGYALVPGENRIQTVDDVPVGPLWNTLQYWGGERQHKRWHMERPILASPRRNDCPAFMDGKMCAVQVWLRDDERLYDALAELCVECQTGLNGSPAAGTIRAIMLA